MDLSKRHKFARFSNFSRTLALIVSPFLFGFAASAQTPAISEVSKTASNSVAKTAPADDYKKGLSDLAALYEIEVQRLEKENTQLKDLYKDGLVARMVVEANEKSLSDARAKLEKARTDIAEANKPAAPIVADRSAVLFGASDTSWSTRNSKVDGLIRLYGNKYGVDSYLIYCLMSQESGFSSGATSNKGAQGLMQLMPGTAARYGVTNPYDVAQSIMGGTRYLKDLLTMFNGRIDLALAGYNAGEGAVIKYNYSIPPYSETRNYVRLISMRYSKGKAPKTLTKPAI